MTVQEQRELAIALGLKPEATPQQMRRRAQALRKRAVVIVDRGPTEPLQPLPSNPLDPVYPFPFPNQTICGLDKYS